MRLGIRLLAVLLILQLTLAAVLAMRSNPLAAAPADAPLVPASIRAADHVIIEGTPAAGTTDAAGTAGTAGTGGLAGDIARVELIKQNGAWILPGYFNAPANGSKLTDLLNRLTSLKRGLPIATSATALQRFKVVDQAFERRLLFSQGSKALSTVYVGSSPGLRKSDARTGADRAVYAVDLASYDLPTQSADWFNADLLKREPASLVELDVMSTPSDHFKLIRPTQSGSQTNSWSDPDLPPGKKIDAAHADALALQVAELPVVAVLGTQPQPAWQQDHPVLTASSKDKSGHAAAWTLSKPSSGDYYVLKSSALPWYFSISSTSAKALIEASSRVALFGGTAPTAAPPAAKTAGAKKP